MLRIHKGYCVADVRIKAFWNTKNVSIQNLDFKYCFSLAFEKLQIGMTLKLIKVLSFLNLYIVNDSII